MKAKEFQNKILSWSDENNFDHLPWRQTRDPYCVMVSEVMLQQTQIVRVLEKYDQWMKRFPTVQDLAQSSLREVLEVWQGLGYNRRGKFLHEAAKQIVSEYSSAISSDPDELMKLPGVGHYTSHAVACFASENCSPFLDTNIRRVYIYFFFIDQTEIDDKDVLEKIRECEPAQNKRGWYLALMDYGREVLGKKKRNANSKSKHYSKQSKFEGSRRQARAAVVRELVKSSSPRTKDELLETIREEISDEYSSPVEFEKIILALHGEGMIRAEDDAWRV